MISTFKLKFGRGPGIPPEPIKVTPVTVFVGPNNSGKSKVLLEIDHFCMEGKKDPFTLILEDLTCSGLSPEKALQVVENLKQNTYKQRGSVHDNQVSLRSSRPGQSRSSSISIADLNKLLQNPNTPELCRLFLCHSTLMLDGHSRMNLVNQQPGGNLREPPILTLQVLFRDDAKRQEVLRVVSEAFGLYFVIDPTNSGQLHIRLSQREPVGNLEKRLETEAIEFFTNAQPIESMGDGVKAFTGIVIELIAGDPRVLLIDEPEAFLHPSLAYKLGYEVSRAALSADKRVFASTHSPPFVMGCIQSGAPVNIVRLTYREPIATARLLPSAELQVLMRNPLLRSTGILSGLFYEFVIVTESDADRAFYQEVNERLLRFKPEWGIPNCQFLNAQNKQTVQTIIRPLRHLGIPAASVVDVDVLKDGGATWTHLLGSANVPDIEHGPLGSQRIAVKDAMEKTGKDMKRHGGVAILQGPDQEAALNLLGHLGEYGIFVVPGGELESWLKPLGISGHGPSWLINAFEKMGENPDAADYLKPGNDDVWAFMQKIKTWLIDSRRKGIPA